MRTLAGPTARPLVCFLALGLTATSCWAQTVIKRFSGRRVVEAVSTVNRALVMLRRFFGWLAEGGIIPANVAQPAEELRRQALASTP